MASITYAQTMALRPHAVALAPEEIRRVQRLFYPQQSHDLQIKAELNKLTRQTYSDVIAKLKARVKEDPLIRHEIIKEVLDASQVQQLYASLYAEIVSQTCDADLHETIMTKLFIKLSANEHNVKALRGMSQFLLHWLKYSGLVFNSVLDRITALPSRSQIILFSTLFRENESLLDECPDIVNRLLAFIDDTSIPFQYKVDLLSFQETLAKRKDAQSAEVLPNHWDTDSTDSDDGFHHSMASTKAPGVSDVQ